VALRTATTTTMSLTMAIDWIVKREAYLGAHSSSGNHEIHCVTGVKVRVNKKSSYPDEDAGSLDLVGIGR
jgi:hypothetical protein